LGLSTKPKYLAIADRTRIENTDITNGVITSGNATIVLSIT